MADKEMLGGAVDLFGWAELPHDWRFDMLGNRCTIRRGASPRPAGDPRYFGSGTIPWIKIGDATRTSGRYIESTDQSVNQEGAKLSVQIPAGSLIIANSGVSLGFAAITRIDGCIHDGWLLTTDFRDLDRDYLYYCVNLVTHRIRNFADGTTQPNLNTDIARRLLLPMPPLTEQKSIAHILGTLDDKIELNRRMNETLEAMARALFKSWFVDFDPVRAKAEGRDPGLPKPLADLFPDSFEDSELGEIPRGWQVQKLAELCSTQYGYTASAVPEPVGPKFVRVTDINKRNWIEWTNVPHCPIDAKAKEDYALQVGDIVVARMADPGKSAIIEEELDAVFASYLVRLKSESLANSYYVYGFLKSDLYLEYVGGAKSGSVQANMNAKVIVDTNIVVPSLPLIDHYFKAVLPLRKRLIASVQETSTLATLRDTLLPKLISGELRIKDAKKFISRISCP